MNNIFIRHDNESYMPHRICTCHNQGFSIFYPNCYIATHAASYGKMKGEARVKVAFTSTGSTFLSHVSGFALAWQKRPSMWFTFQVPSDEFIRRV